MADFQFALIRGVHRLSDFSAAFARDRGKGVFFFLKKGRLKRCVRPAFAEPAIRLEIRTAFDVADFLFFADAHGLVEQGL